jgi:beta-phosphoglucomutase
MLENRVSAVVFDMDGVLIDSHPAHHAAWRKFFQSLGADISDQELSFILDGRTRNEILRHFLGDLPEAELQRYGHCKDEVFRSMEARIEPLPGVVQFLGELRRSGAAMAIATSASEIRTFSTIERLGLAEYFEAIITASDVAAGKPNPAVYRLACECLNVSPALSLAFDDASAGVVSARAAGMRCIGVASNGLSQRLMDAGAEAVIEDFRGMSLNVVPKAA